MNVFVTGGAGYIGSICVEQLLDCRHSVTVYDNLSEGHRGAVDKRASFIEAHLSEEDRKELLPSARQSKFDNRVRWASSYLKKGLLIEAVGRGRFRITQRGRDVLKENPERIDVKFLSRFFQDRQYFVRDGDNIARLQRPVQKCRVGGVGAERIAVDESKLRG